VNRPSFLAGASGSSLAGSAYRVNLQEGNTGYTRAAQRADAPDREIMGIRHKTMPIEGVQFHPESFLTDEGKTLLANFLKM